MAVINYLTTVQFDFGALVRCGSLGPAWRVSGGAWGGGGPLRSRRVGLHRIQRASLKARTGVGKSFVQGVDQRVAARI